MKRENEKLQDIADKLDISENDIKKIKKDRIIQKYRYQIVGTLIALQSIVLGYLIGINSEPRRINRSKYPWYRDFCWICPIIGVSSIFGILYLDKKISHHLKTHPERRESFFKKFTIFLTILVSIIGFIAAFRIGQPVEYYGEQILYGVYNKKKEA